MLSPSAYAMQGQYITFYSKMTTVEEAYYKLDKQKKEIQQRIDSLKQLTDWRPPNKNVRR